MAPIYVYHWHKFNIHTRVTMIARSTSFHTCNLSPYDWTNWGLFKHSLSQYHEVCLKQQCQVCLQEASGWPETFLMKVHNLTKSQQKFFNRFFKVWKLLTFTCFMCIWAYKGPEHCQLRHFEALCNYWFIASAVEE